VTNPPSWRDRIIVTGEDRDEWEEARRPVWGASDAKGLSKLESVPLYIAAKMAPSTFHGNERTRSGYRWEPMMLAWLGIPENKALIRHPEWDDAGATPDGVIDLDDGAVGLAECKAKHDRIVYGPTLPELRQVAWQFMCVPEALWCDWTWVELVRGADGEYDLRAGQRTPQKVRIMRDDPKVLDVTERLQAIATELRPAWAAARRFEREHTP
jgi:hypothetical protein